MGRPGWTGEEDKATKLIGEALSALDEAMKSDCWGYVKEYELGRLDIAKYILQLTYNELADEPKLLCPEIRGGIKLPSIEMPPELTGEAKIQTERTETVSNDQAG